LAWHYNSFHEAQWLVWWSCQAAYKIKEECKKFNLENDRGDSKEQLKWWIEGILKGKVELRCSGG